MNDTIVDLTKLWYQVVNLDHHKDKDCHWYINIEYSYGGKPVYVVKHYGYIHTDVNKSFRDLVNAESYLMIELCWALSHAYTLIEGAKEIIDEHPLCKLVKAAQQR